MVVPLITAILQCNEVQQIIFTCNIPEFISLPENNRLLILKNEEPAGFARNHNRAFRYCNQPYFCPLNPDIELRDNPFSPLLATMAQTGASVVGPLVLNPQGVVEDSMRRFPTPISLLLKACGASKQDYSVEVLRKNPYVDWIAGMFLVFRSADFHRLQGFDERFFLYYEDVDICARTWKTGMKVAVCPSVTVMHDARRTSHHNFKYLRWHLASMLRYFCKHWGQQPRLPE